MCDHSLLRETILQNSNSCHWNSAVLEWEIYSMVEDENRQSICICGKEGLRYLYEIKNTLNGNTLFPIGSTCINKFERIELNEEVENRDKMLQLMNAVKNGQKIHLSSTHFTRKLLVYLYKNNVFVPTEYNKHDGYNDYQFMLDMFNKRTWTISQERKSIAIIMNSIIPYIQRLIKP